MNAKTTVRPPTLWKSLRTPALLLTVVAAMAGAAYWTFLREPSPAWLVRWKVTSFLKKHSGKSNFETPFKFPSAAEMAKKPAPPAPPVPTPVGQRTKKTFEVLKQEFLDLELVIQGRSRENAEFADRATQLRTHLARLENGQAFTNLANLTNAPAPNLPMTVSSVQQILVDLTSKITTNQVVIAEKEIVVAPIREDLEEIQRHWAAQQPAAIAELPELARAQVELISEARQKMQAANTYNVIYNSIGQELWVAGKLLNTENPVIRQSGLQLARQAARDAMEYAQNPWLAARIVQGYGWPNLDLGTPTGNGPLSLDNLLNEMGDVFQQADEIANVIHTYQLQLKLSPDSQRADMTRFRLAMIHEQNGDLNQALSTLRDIKNTNSVRWVTQRITALEQRVKKK